MPGKTRASLRAKMLFNVERSNLSNADKECIRNVLNRFENMVEVVHGEWIEGKTLEKCSICGKKGFPDWKYCPNCGAKMDGGRTDD